MSPYCPPYCLSNDNKLNIIYTYLLGTVSSIRTFTSIMNGWNTFIYLVNTWSKFNYLGKYLFVLRMTGRRWREHSHCRSCFPHRAEGPHHLPHLEDHGKHNFVQLCKVRSSKNLIIYITERPSQLPIVNFSRLHALISYKKPFIHFRIKTTVRKQGPVLES